MLLFLFLYLFFKSGFFFPEGTRFALFPFPPFRKHIYPLSPSFFYPFTPILSHASLPLFLPSFLPPSHLIPSSSTPHRPNHHHCRPSLSLARPLFILLPSLFPSLSSPYFLNHASSSLLLPPLSSSFLLLFFSQHHFVGHSHHYPASLCSPDASCRAMWRTIPIFI